MKQPLTRMRLFGALFILSVACTLSITRRGGSQNGVADNYLPAGLMPGQPATGLLADLRGIKAPHQQPAALNTDSLKGSNWYSTVMADIAHKSYFINTAADSATSSNMQQGMNATYRATGFTLSEMQAPDEPRKAGELPTSKQSTTKQPGNCTFRWTGCMQATNLYPPPPAPVSPPIPVWSVLLQQA